MAVSIVAHAAVILVVRDRTRSAFRAAPDLDGSAVMIDFVEAPRTSQSTEPLIPRQSAQGDGARAPNDARAVRSTARGAHLVSQRRLRDAPHEDPASLAALTPAGDVAGVATERPRAISVPALFTSPLAGVGMDVGVAPRSSDRDGFFGRPDGVRDVGAIARAPTESVLGGAQHQQAAGTMEHDRTASRRIAEQLMAVTAVPGLARDVMRAPLLNLGPVTHETNVRESDPGGDTLGLPPVAYGGTSACPAPHVLGVQITIEQSEGETIANAYVTHSSGRTALDAMALDAVRDAVAAAAPIRSRAPRRSRWRVEIGNRPSASRVLCTEGWMIVPADPVDGVYLMIRVREEREAR